MPARSITRVCWRTRRDLIQLLGELLLPFEIMMMMKMLKLRKSLFPVCALVVCWRSVFLTFLLWKLMRIREPRFWNHFNPLLCGVIVFLNIPHGEPVAGVRKGLAPGVWQGWGDAWGARSVLRGYPSFSRRALSTTFSPTEDVLEMIHNFVFSLLFLIKHFLKEWFGWEWVRLGFTGVEVCDLRSFGSSVWWGNIVL